MISHQDTPLLVATQKFIAATIACLDASGPAMPVAQERQIFSKLLGNSLGEFTTPTPVRLPCVDFLPAAMRSEHATSQAHAELLKACVEVAPFCQWRNKYQGGGNVDLVERFGFCDVVGPDGYVKSESVTLGLVLLGPHTFYPHHEHSARELYFVLSGSAQWGVDQEPLITREPGAFILHRENQPHAMRTMDQPLLAVSIWRGRITTGSNFIS